MTRTNSVLLPDRVSFLLISEYLLSLFCFGGASLVLFGLPGLDPQPLWGAAFAAASVLLGCFLNGLYQNLQWRSRIALCLQLCSVFGMALVLQGLLSYLHSGIRLSHWVMIAGIIPNFILMAAWRISYVALLPNVLGSRPILFLGCDEVVREIADQVAKRPELGFSAAGFLSDLHPLGTPIAGGGVVEGDMGHLPEVIDRLRPGMITVGVGEMRSQFPVAALVEAKRRGIEVREVGTAFELVCGRVCSRAFRPSQIIFANEMAAKPGVLALQSIYSNLMGMLSFVVVLPVIVIVTAAIRLSSRGPAFLTEIYTGMNGVPFVSSRFRCTVLHNSDRETRVGGWVRTLHIEFLPRVFNILRGEMALVGPEPDRVAFAECLAGLIPIYRQRQVVKPGLTGWSQIQHERGVLPDTLRQVECDLYYTKHFSLALDAYILLHTLRRNLPFGD